MKDPILGSKGALLLVLWIADVELSWGKLSWSYLGVKTNKTRQLFTRLVSQFNHCIIIGIDNKVSQTTEKLEIIRWYLWSLPASLLELLASFCPWLAGGLAAGCLRSIGPQLCGV